MTPKKEYHYRIGLNHIESAQHWLSHAMQEIEHATGAQSEQMIQLRNLCEATMTIRLKLASMQTGEK